jgi:two-component system NarL family sensor kinase
MPNSRRNQLQQANLSQLAAEAERKRLALELNVGLGQLLTQLEFRVQETLGLLESARMDDAKNRLWDVVAQLRAATADVHRIAAELRPRMLDDQGLLATLQWFASQFEVMHPGVAVRLELSVAEDIVPADLKTTVFRLVQEALSNVARHSDATTVFIYVRAHQSTFMVGIVDNGIGFDAGQMMAGDYCLLGAGINAMRERIEISSGKFKIQSYVGSGTAVTASWGVDSSLVTSGLGLLDNNAPFDTGMAALDVDISNLE